MPANAKWPDFRLASTLRSLMGSQSSEPPNRATSGHESPLPPELPDQGDAFHGDRLEGHRTKGADSAMADPHAPMPHGLEGFVSDGNDHQMADVDADFGSLEMFDSNASQVPFSSQANVAPFASGGQATEAIMSEDVASLASSKKSKRDKKDKKKKDFSHQVESSLPPVDGDGKKKHKKSKKKSARGSEVPGSQPPTDAAAGNDQVASTAMTAGGAADAADAPSTLNGNDEAAVPSTQSKKKRKFSDSADGKQRKKRRSHGQEGGEEGGAAHADVAAMSASFLRRKKGTGIPSESALEEDNAPESDPQKSPTVAHVRRRSQSHEARSRENSTPPPAGADGMEIDLGTEEALASAAAEGMGVDPDVETLAREAWNEHRNGQMALDDAPDAPGVPAPVMEPPTASPRRTRSTRKKAKPTFFEQPPVEDAADGDGGNRDALEDLPSPTAVSPKPRNRVKAATKKTAKGRKPKREKLSQSMRGGSDDEAGGDGGEPHQTRRNRLIGYTQGRFTDDELARIASAVERFRVENGTTQEEVNEMIQAPGGTTAGDAHAQLWVRIFAECPDRHRQKVINITRKKFHNFVARGTWTLEQDTELSELIGVHGQKWSRIAAIINRHPEDLRDRYRNYLVCGPNQRKDSWDEAEEANLTQYVIDSMHTIDHLRVTEPNHHLLTRSYDELIDWQGISERMNRTRSRLQCITKWKSLNIRTNGKDKLISNEPDSQISFRLEKARRQLSAMPEEEKFRLLLAIQGTAVGKDGKIPWPKLVDKRFRNQWHRTTQALLWRRLKQAVPDWETQTTRDCAQYLIERYNQTGELPEVDVDSYDDTQEMELIKSIPTSSIGANGTAVAKEKEGKSAEFVENSDAEENGAAPNGDADEGMEELEMNIDPALTPTPVPAKKATLAKRTGSGKPPSSRRKPKTAATAIMDPIEDDDESRDQPAPDQSAPGQPEDSEIDVEQFRKKTTPKKFRSPGGKNKAHLSSPRTADSDSIMDDMEDLPARVPP
ncbi:RNA polymerase I termination factor [Tolypocladium paradoxum]|uniref:RNA polymerase I termination factor n=1 Tax=Tolypocladium paradoxum TaxID=94208 RepID=A0A2S4KZB2_9HYPO|nr:RNA polymerase I termination factor [Tolypocladium paradoxum]